MAWFLNLYKCDRCKRRWTDEWSCMCDDECPHCGARDMTPYESEDLTELRCAPPNRPSTIPTIVKSAVSRRERQLKNSWPRPSYPNLVIPEAA
jgi:PHP family Zn ribbon phosphoesterase